MSEPPRERFSLVLEALPSEVPAARRLAQALKHLLRAHRLRCVVARSLGTNHGQGESAIKVDATQESR